VSFSSIFTDPHTLPKPARFHLHRDFLVGTWRQRTNDGRVAIVDKTGHPYQETTRKFLLSGRWGAKHEFQIFRSQIVRSARSCQVLCVLSVTPPVRAVVQHGRYLVVSRVEKHSTDWKMERKEGMLGKLAAVASERPDRGNYFRRYC